MANTHRSSSSSRCGIHKSDVCRGRTVVHLASTQEELAESLITAADVIDHESATSLMMQPPITAYTYHKVSAGPPFPYDMKAPALVVAGEKSTADPYTRSAVSLSYSRTLELLRRTIGPYFELEKLWEKHTYYVGFLSSGA